MENKGKKKSMVDMELSTFEIPPSGDVLVLGKRCPIGPQAAERMLRTVAPEQFELVQPEDDLIGGILIKKHLFLRADKEPLIKAIVEESKAIMGPSCMIRIKCDITVTVKRGI